MSHLIILPGNSLKNRAWGESVLEHYAPQFDSAHMLNYSHWESGDKNINFLIEQNKLLAHAATLPTGTEIIIFAKSAGSLLAFKAVGAGAITPTKCIFFGIPFDLAAADIFKDAWDVVDTFLLPTLAFHNVEDPTTSYEFTKTTLDSHAPAVTFITTHEANHWYGDFVKYDEHILPFLH